jgi:hypothetical protein
VSQPNEKPVALKVKEEKIISVNLPQIDCDMMDARTRKVLVFLIDAELKRNRSYPKEWVGGVNGELAAIKEGLEMCSKVRKRREENAEQRVGATGSSPEPSSPT